MDSLVYTYNCGYLYTDTFYKDALKKLVMLWQQKDELFVHCTWLNSTKKVQKKAHTKKLWTDLNTYSTGFHRIHI